METNEFVELKKEILELKKIILENLTSQVSEKWIPRAEVIKFFNYGPTQMANLEKSLTTTKVGKRKFILKESLERLLESKSSARISGENIDLLE